MECHNKEASVHRKHQEEEKPPQNSLPQNYMLAEQRNQN